MATGNKIFNFNKEINLYAPRVEEIGEFENSIFEDIYKAAAKVVGEIVEKNEAKNNGKPAMGVNNIIAFLGERGSGKSSAMISFYRALSCLKDKKNNFLQEIIDRKVTFSCLEIIDPSSFEDGESVFEVILAKMFEQFKEKLGKTQCEEKITSENKRQLLDNFQKVYENLRIIKNKERNKYNESEDLVESLSNLAGSTKLTENFQNLINSFLSFITPYEDAKKNYLVIPIDDFDMNVKSAYSICEEIRKYMLIPKVIILIGGKMESLQKAVQQQFTYDFKLLMEHCNMPCSDVKDFAIKYLIKFIPEDHRIFIQNDPETYDIIFNNTNGEVEKNDNVRLNLQEFIINELYEKTGLLLVKPKHGIHPLIPNIQRELNELLLIISKFEDVIVDHSLQEISNYKNINKKKKLNNFRRYKSYFLDTWISRNLTAGFLNNFQKIVNASYSEKNQQTVLIANYTFQDSASREKKSSYFMINDTEYSEITDILNYPQKISLGDVIQVLIETDLHKKTDELWKNFTQAIRNYYSLLLTENILQYDITQNTEYLDNLTNLVGSYFIPSQIKVLRPVNENDRRDEFQVFSKDETVLNFLTENLNKLLTCDKDVLRTSCYQNTFIWLNYFILFFQDLQVIKNRKEKVTSFQASATTGAVKHFTFNINAFTILFLNEANILDRWDKSILLNKGIDVNQSQLVLSIKEWKQQNGIMLFPFNSIEFVQELFIESWDFNQGFFKQIIPDDYCEIFKNYFNLLFDQINNLHRLPSGIFETLKLQLYSNPLFNNYLDQSVATDEDKVEFQLRDEMLNLLFKNRVVKFSTALVNSIATLKSWIKSRKHSSVSNFIRDLKPQIETIRANKSTQRLASQLDSRLLPDIAKRYTDVGTLKDVLYETIDSFNPEQNEPA